MDFVKLKLYLYLPLIMDIENLIKVSTTIRNFALGFFSIIVKFPDDTISIVFDTL